jgi:hypothetical protein
MWGFGILATFTVINELKMGQCYSFSVFMGDGTKISQSDSPIAFWTNAAFQMFGLLVAYITPIFMFGEVFVEHKRKVKALISEKK